MPNIAAQPQKAEQEPDIPPAVAKRKAVALTHIAAEDGRAQEKAGLTTVGQSGRRNINEGLARLNAGRSKEAKAKKARKTAEAAMPADPLKGLNAADIDKIRSRSYPKAPAMDPMVGDKTQTFVNWLYKNHPKDAAVRYAYRDVWPTE